MDLIVEAKNELLAEVCITVLSLSHTDFFFHVTRNGFWPWPEAPEGVIQRRANRGVEWWGSSHLLQHDESQGEE